MNLPEIYRKDNCLGHMKKLKKMKNDQIIWGFKREIIMIVHLHINQNHNQQTKNICIYIKS